MPKLWYNICMTITKQLQEQKDFTGNETDIANYILSHKDDVLQMSIQSLASATYTSTSAVMRLCQRMNLSGFKEFKISFAQELSQPADAYPEIDPNFPFSKNDSISEISEQLKQLTIQTLQDTQRSLSVHDLKRACFMLKKAQNVAIFGVGDAYLAGLTFQARLTRIGVNFLATPVYGEQGHLARTMSPKDCSLLLSYSGTTESTLTCAKILKNSHVPMICITAEPNSELAKICDIALLLPAKEDKFHRIASFFSQACMEYYLSIMYSYLYVLDYEKYDKDLNGKH